MKGLTKINMEIKVEDIIDGIITGIKKYGIFFKLSEDKIGFCHISKITGQFIDDISKLYNIGDSVKVKVINIKDNGQIELSIKDVVNNIPQKPQFNTNKKQYNNTNKFTQPIKKKEPESFEDMLQAFMKNSDSKFKDMNARNQKRKH